MVAYWQNGIDSNCKLLWWHSVFFIACELGMGARLFSETIKKNEAFLICPCESFYKYLKGECTCEASDLRYMGEGIPTGWVICHKITKTIQWPINMQLLWMSLTALLASFKWSPRLRWSLLKRNLRKIYRRHLLLQLSPSRALLQLNPRQ